MKTGEEILKHARLLFDMAGVARLPAGDYLLILGLESTPERDLDEFGREDGRFKMYGFEKYTSHRLESMLDFNGNGGYLAQLTGPYGYPLEGEINLKDAAIRAGLGKRGKSSIVLHPEYGARLRFMGIRTNAPLNSLVPLPQPDTENPVCTGCMICIDKCPVEILEPYRITDISVCLSNVTPLTAEGRSILCDICLKECPANR